MAQDEVNTTLTQGRPINISMDAIIAIEQQNLWQAGVAIPPEFAPDNERYLAQNLYQWLQQNKSRHIQVILGPRRVGKTVVLYQIIRTLLADGKHPSRVFFLQLDDPDFKTTTLGNLVRYVIQVSGATATEPTYLMLDEVVAMEDWDKWLKTIYDGNWPVRIVATSSARTGLKLGQTESGLDRWREQYMLPCRLAESLKLLDALTEQMAQIPVGSTLRETLGNIHSLAPFEDDREKNELRRHRDMLLQVGGFPEFLVASLQSNRLVHQQLFDTGERDAFPLPHQMQLYDSIVDKSIYRDAPKFFNVNDPSSLETILYRAARQMGTQWKPTKVSNDLEVPLQTLNNYTKYLEMASLIVMLANFPGGEGKSQSRGKKLYFIDTALRNAVLRAKRSRHSSPADFGHMLENLVVSSLFSLAEQTRFRLYHWRQGKAGEYEVDVIYNDVNDPLAFEVGASHKHSLAGLQALINKHPQFSGSSYLVSPDVGFRPAELSHNGIGTVPLDLFLLVVDLQAAHALKLRFSY